MIMTFIRDVNEYHYYLYLFFIYIGKLVLFILLSQTENSSQLHILIIYRLAKSYVLTILLKNPLPPILSAKSFTLEQFKAVEMNNKRLESSA